MPECINTLKPGDIITIDSFNLQNLKGEDKLIWCIYLGNDGIFDCPIFIYFCRTTTQIDDFKPGGKREKHKYKMFQKGQYGFEKDCLIDYDERLYSNIPKERFNTFKIEVKGHLPNHILQEIWNSCLKKNRFLNSFQLKSIRDSFAKVGISVK